MLKIKVIDAIHDVIRVDREGKKPLLLYKQHAWCFFEGVPYPKEIQVTQWPDRETGEAPKPYPAGDYTLGEKSFSIGQYMDLQISPVLIPLSHSDKSKSA